MGRYVLLVLLLAAAEIQADLRLDVNADVPSSTLCDSSCAPSRSACFLAAAGTPAHLSFVVTNTGPSAATPHFFFLFGGGATLADFTPPAGTSDCSFINFDPVSPEIVCTTNPVIPAGESRVYSVTYARQRLVSGLAASLGNENGGGLEPDDLRALCLRFAPMDTAPAMSTSILIILATAIGTVGVLRLRG